MFSPRRVQRRSHYDNSSSAQFFETVKRFYLCNIEPYFSRSHQLYAIFALVGVWMCTGLFCKVLCGLIGIIYPLVQSVKAIESPSGSDDTEWLMYWVVFASFSCLEFFSDILLSWFPFYFLIKCIFLLWCMAPISYNGSKVIYNRLIRPWVLQNENKIDEVLGFVSNNVEKMADKVTNAGASAEADLSQTVTNAVASKIGSILGGSSEQETKKSE